MESITSVQILNYIYKNAEMGMIGIDDVLPKISNREFKNVLLSQRNEYNSITEEAEKLLKLYDKDNSEIGLMAKVGTKLMSEMSLLKDNVNKAVAKMMMDGTNKGITELIEKINVYNGEDEDIIKLCKRFQSFLENNIEELKKYL